MTKTSIISFLFIITSFHIFSQNVSDLGKLSFVEVQNMQSISACEVSQNKILTYCVENGNLISFIFEEGILNGIMLSTAFPTKSQAEQNLAKQINTFETKNNVAPYHSNGQTFFETPNSNLSISYGIKERNGTYYVMYYTFLFND